MRFWSHDRHGFPLPEGHRFPLPKYRLLREAVEREGLGAVCGSDAAPWDLLATVHERDYLDRVRRGELTRREERALGLPWSPELVERGRRSTFGTVHAARDALDRGLGMNLGGGTHHAAFAQGRGYCLFNDVVVAIAALRAEAGLGRVLVVDCDVHQGDGTAELLAGDPRSFTLSLHGGANYPFHRATSDLDVDLRTGTGDEEYLDALDDALATAVPTAHPDLVFFLAGADPWGGRPPGAPRAHEGGPARPRRARPRRRRARRRAGLRRARRRLRARRRRHRRDQPGDGARGHRARSG
jgi:acetoin utilization deacetylase AcuC-like enzyme